MVFKSLKEVVETLEKEYYFPQDFLLGKYIIGDTEIEISAGTPWRFPKMFSLKNGFIMMVWEDIFSPSIRFAIVSEGETVDENTYVTIPKEMREEFYKVVEINRVG